MGLNKSTVYRIEDVADRPDYQVTVDTIIKWLDATSGETLAMFFCRVEMGNTNDLQAYFNLRMTLKEARAHIERLHRKVQELDLPDTSNTFLKRLERTLHRVAGIRRTPSKRRKAV